MRRKNKIFIGIGIVLLLMIVTNPSQSDYNNLLKIKYGKSCIGGRTKDFFLFSIYECNNCEETDYGNNDSAKFDSQTHVALFRNFIRVKHSPNEIANLVAIKKVIDANKSAAKDSVDQANAISSARARAQRESDSIAETNGFQKRNF